MIKIKSSEKVDFVSEKSKKGWLGKKFWLLLLVGFAIVVVFWFGSRSSLVRNFGEPSDFDSVISEPEKEEIKEIVYSHRYDVSNEDSEDLIKKTVEFSLPLPKDSSQISSYVKEVDFFVDPLLDTYPPEEYSYVKIETPTSGCFIDTRGGFRIPESESWELIFKEKLGNIDYGMVSAGSKGNVDGVITDLGDIDIPISFQITWGTDSMDDCVDDVKKVLDLLEYKLIE